MVQGRHGIDGSSLRIAEEGGRARFLLLQGKLGPSEVALEVGFAHQSHMARWMHRELGCSPGDLRRTAINR
ncbi:AraC family transcriptional regulator [Bradyrhizobium sp. Leo121]|uniref:helix-turn-helix domain-containing protein n=1 Tax=Bradyrhizobium sp. Leo121 TaxID=1571195 RepID=UPI001FE15F16|nr:AraC family transcriptional regulator [Bradyrhizobium sp. Leo121]